MCLAAAQGKHSPGKTLQKTNIHYFSYCPYDDGRRWRPLCWKNVLSRQHRSRQSERFAQKSNVTSRCRRAVSGVNYTSSKSKLPVLHLHPISCKLLWGWTTPVVPVPVVSICIKGKNAIQGISKSPIFLYYEETTLFEVMETRKTENMKY